MSESTSKAFDLLFYIANAGGQTLAQIARDTGWDKATALRYLNSMEKKGIVERRGGEWILGLALLELASKVPVTQTIADRANPVLRDLANTTGETANLAALAGQEVIYLAKADGGRNLRLRSNPGDRLPLYCTAVGKCILARLDATFRAEYLSRGHFAPVTARTVTDPARLSAELDATLARGWAIDDEELEPGLICYAMPIEVPKYSFAGAISVSGPSVRMRNARDEILVHISGAASKVVAAIEGGPADGNVGSYIRGGFRSTDWHRPGTEIQE